MEPPIQGILPSTCQWVEIRISEGKIREIIKLDPPGGKSSDDIYLAQGLTDIQVNGFGGVDFNEPGLTVDQVKWVTRELRMEGVVSFLPTLISGDPEVVKANLEIIARAMGEGGSQPSIPGVHLEGPYISPIEGYRGAHNARWICKPVWEDFLQYYQAAQGHIVLITLAPEIEGALDFIRRVKDLGVVIALGHHNANPSTIARAVDAGASISTHLGNGCANQIDRHQNPIWPQLAEDRLMASIIADGAHLTREEVKVFYKAKGAQRLVLISDMTKLAGRPEGAYWWDHKKVVLQSGRISYPDQGVLAGSAMPLRKGLENIMEFTGCSLAEALEMASENPNRLLGQCHPEMLAVGNPAHIIQFRFRGGKISILKTWIGGRLVFEGPDPGDETSPT